MIWKKQNFDIIILGIRIVETLLTRFYLFICKKKERNFNYDLLYIYNSLLLGGEFFMFLLVNKISKKLKKPKIFFSFPLNKKFLLFFLLI